MRALAILCVKNEGPFLLDWLAHHRHVGFTDFLVFSNDCSDGTDQMLDRLQVLGWLTHVRNDRPGDRGPQWTALQLAARHPAFARADWVQVLDIDEYVNIHLGDCTLAALTSAHPAATAFAMTWRMFGNAGEVAIEDHAVTRRFVHAAPSVLFWPWRAQHIKTLFRNDGSFTKLGVHRPRKPDPLRLPAQLWIGGSGQPVDPDPTTARVFSTLGQNHHQQFQLNHYALGSMQDYLVKCDRGRANREGTPFDLGYWVERNFSDVEDRSIHRHDSIALARDLRADPVLGPLHRDALAWRKARFVTLMADEPGRALYGRLLMTPPTRAISQKEARTVWEHLQVD